jgi:hypothetical protein
MKFLDVVWYRACELLSTPKRVVTALLIWGVAMGTVIVLTLLGVIH